MFLLASTSIGVEQKSDKGAAQPLLWNGEIQNSKKSLVFLFESNESISQKNQNNANREPFEKKSAQTENLKPGTREREREKREAKLTERLESN